MRVGVVSDTHNLLRPRVLERLAGCERILHAGDVGELAILDGLRRIAPVEAVRGNTDTGAAAELRWPPHPASGCSSTAPAPWARWERSPPAPRSPRRSSTIPPPSPGWTASNSRPGSTSATPTTST